MYQLGGEVLPVGETLPPADQEETLTVLNETCTFYFYGIKNAAEWQESRTIILNVVKLYLENELLMRRIAWENEHDRATLLRNRAAFRRDCLTKYGALPELSIIFLDIDHLKEVNDTHGHDMGDRLICKAANVLLEIEDDSVCAYRMGGDEFVVACAFGREQAEELLGTIQKKLDESNRRTPMPFISISKGLACASGAFDVEKLVREADEEMYADKLSRKAQRGSAQM